MTRPASQAQRGLVHKLFRDAGIQTSEERADYFRQVVCIDRSHVSDLTAAEAAVTIELLQAGES